MEKTKLKRQPIPAWKLEALSGIKSDPNDTRTYNERYNDAVEKDKKIKADQEQYDLDREMYDNLPQEVKDQKSEALEQLRRRLIKGALQKLSGASKE